MSLRAAKERRHPSSSASLSSLPSPGPALEFTGERFTPETRGAIWHEHWHRYCAVLPLARGKRVLDAACGEGYGSHLLAKEARSVIGIDLAEGAVSHARARYARRGLEFVQGSVTALPLADHGVDLVVSFETIEHLAEQREMLREFRRVLTADGVLAISSPNRPEYRGLGEGEGDANHFHVRELDRDELKALLDEAFPSQRWYGQRVVAASALWTELTTGGGGIEFPALVGDEVRARARISEPVYFIVVCAAPGVSVSALADLSLFDDGAQSLWQDHVDLRRKERHCHFDLIDMRKVAESRQAELVAAVNALASERQKTEALTDRVEQLLDYGASRQAELERTQQAFAHEAREGERLRTESQTHAARVAYLEARCGAADARSAEADARLAYRESLRGWLRWPMARLRQRVTGTG